MKILRITSIGYEGGGADNGIILVNKMLKKMGHEVKTLSSNHRPEIAHFSDFEFKSLDYQPSILKIFYRIFYPNSYSALKKVLKEYQPDIVQLHTMSKVSPSVLFLLKEYPAVMTVHGAEDFTTSLLLWSFPSNLFKKKPCKVANLNILGWLHYIYHRFINGSVYRIGFRNIDLFISFSQYMKRNLKKDGIESVCVPNATELFEYTPIDLNSNTLLYVGRMEEAKGVEFLIRAMPSIISAHPKTELFLAGTGPHEDYLEKLAKELGVKDNINFLGHLKREQLNDLYNKSKILIVPSVWPEPFGKIGIEAMSVGRPVIASDVGGISEWLLDGKTGFLVPPEDSSAIAEKVIKLLSDPIAIQEMSLNARHQAENFSIEVHTERIIKLYQDVISKCKKKKDEKKEN